MKKVLILGAGITGLSVGLLLLKKGIDHLIIEKSESQPLKLNETLTPGARARLKALGIKIPATLLKIPEVRYLSPDGENSIHIRAYSKDQFLTVNKARLEAYIQAKYLSTGGQILLKHQLQSIERSDGKFNLVFANGNQFSADVIFNCMGKLQAFERFASYKKTDVPLDKRISLFTHYRLSHKLGINKNYIIPFGDAYLYLLPMGKLDFTCHS